MSVGGGPLATMRQLVVDMVDMVTDPDYRLSWALKAGGVVALVCLALPSDLRVPGYIDLVFVLGLLWRERSKYLDFVHKMGQ